jgi:hypothetical protein
MIEVSPLLCTSTTRGGSFKIMFVFPCNHGKIYKLKNTQTPLFNRCNYSFKFKEKKMRRAEDVQHEVEARLHHGELNEVDLAATPIAEEPPAPNEDPAHPDVVDPTQPQAWEELDGMSDFTGVTESIAAEREIINLTAENIRLDNERLQQAAELARIREQLAQEQAARRTAEERATQERATARHEIAAQHARVVALQAELAARPTAAEHAIALAAEREARVRAEQALEAEAVRLRVEIGLRVAATTPTVPYTHPKWTSAIQMAKVKHMIPENATLEQLRKEKADLALLFMLDDSCLAADLFRFRP